MSEHTAPAVVYAELQQVVIRCGCSDAIKQRPDFHGRLQQPCPHPQRVEDLGTVAFWHRNPLRRLAWRLSRLLRGRRPGTAAVT